MEWRDAKDELTWRLRARACERALLSLLSTKAAEISCKLFKVPRDITDSIKYNIIAIWIKIVKIKWASECWLDESDLTLRRPSVLSCDLGFHISYFWSLLQIENTLKMESWFICAEGVCRVEQKMIIEKALSNISCNFRQNTRCNEHLKTIGCRPLCIWEMYRKKSVQKLLWLVKSL